MTTLVSGTELALTIHTFEGGTGPVIGVSAAIHGDEPIGVEVVRRLASFLNHPDVELRGTVRLLPVANPLAYETNTRHTPIVHQNLNRLFPGDPATACRRHSRPRSSYRRSGTRGRWGHGAWENLQPLYL